MRIHHRFQDMNAQYPKPHNPSANHKFAHAHYFAAKADVANWAQLMRKAHRCAIVQHSVIVQEQLVRLSACSMTCRYTNSRFDVVMSKHLREDW